MNLALPPFDDMQVRKAVNFVLDKASIVKLREPGSAAIANHIAVDSLERNLLVDYNPYATAGDSGDASKARAEMARSRYDSDHDGVCDVPACRNVPFVVRGHAPNPASGAIVARNLRTIGIVVATEVAAPFSPRLVRSFDPTSKIALTLGSGWVKDFPNASTLFDGLFTNSSIEQSVNASILLGASPDQLRKMGLPGTVGAQRRPEDLGLLGAFRQWANEMLDRARPDTDGAGRPVGAADRAERRADRVRSRRCVQLEPIGLHPGAEPHRVEGRCRVACGFVAGSS